MVWCFLLEQVQEVGSARSTNVTVGTAAVTSHNTCRTGPGPLLHLEGIAWGRFRRLRVETSAYKPEIRNSRGKQAHTNHLGEKQQGSIHTI